MARLGPFPIAVAFALGIAIAPWLDQLGVPASLRWVVVVALAVAASRLRAEVVLVVAVAVGAARGARGTPPAAPGLDDRVLDRIVGEVVGPVVRTGDRSGARLQTSTAPVWVWSDEVLEPGERVAVTGYLSSPRGPRGPALPDRGDALRSRGAELELVARAGQVERLADTPAASARVWRWAERVQLRWSAAIDDAGGDPTGRAALQGIAVGDRARIPPSLDARWRAAGIYHVLSVSGLHLAVVAGLVFWLLRRLVAASPWGGRVRPACWAAPPALAIAIAYTLVTGAQLATVRALLVVALVLVGHMLDRPLRLLDALGVAALAMLVWQPADLFDPGFQLSFVAALTLALRVQREPARGLRGAIVRGVTTSFAIALVTAPITAFHFHQVAAGGLVGNLVLTPAIELVALPLALGGLALGWDAPVALASWLVAQIDRGAGLLAELVPSGHIAIASALVALVLVASSLWLVTRQRRSQRDALAWIVVCAAWALGRSPPPAQALRVTFVDVGQGDAAIVELPDGAVWLVDAGGLANARDLSTASAPGRAIDRVLAAYGHDAIDLVILSHPHPDHYLGLAALDVPVRELWTARELEHAPPPRLALPSFDELAAQLAWRGTVVGHPPLGVARTQAGVELIAWAPRYRATPTAAPILAADPVHTINDNSLVIAIRYRGRTLLFTGDLEAEGEDQLVAAGIAPVDVVKVPHHGSRTSSSPAFVEALRPQLAVISLGRGNQFGFPSLEVVARWQAVGADVARTDRDGTITVVVDDAGALAVERFTRSSP
ncbi:MAG TPA: DNA internalization-related competence protein ComEC/Rec2 [Kofleriaceae bacterium]|nr:DNA internalization-related competence protein ComEC/Rec2 [Kofleriaceae bacterium]